MESLFILIPLSVLAVGVAVGAFFWMNRSGQFDDDQGPAWSILLDDDTPDSSRPRGRSGENDGDGQGAIQDEIDGDIQCEIKQGIKDGGQGNRR